MSGTITQLATGRWWARTPLIEGKRKSLGTHATKEEAEQFLAVFISARKTRSLDASLTTFGKYGAKVLDQREVDDTIRSIKHERRRWNLHLAKCELAEMQLSEIEPIHIANLVRTLQRKKAKDKREPRKISSHTVARCLTMVSNVFQAAIQQGGLVVRNPCIGIEINKRADEDTEDVWTFLTLDEQKRLLTCEQISLTDRLVITFAMFSGVRQGELHHNFLKDLHTDGADPHLYVRFGSKGRRPKGGKARKVPLIPQALDVARQWLPSQGEQGRGDRVPHGDRVPSTVRQDARQRVGGQENGRVGGPAQAHVRARGHRRSPWVALALPSTHVRDLADRRMVGPSGARVVT
jgi:integrase